MRLTTCVLLAAGWTGVACGASMDVSELREYDQQPPAVQRLIRSALEWTKRGVAYRYGSNDPASGATDCSGFVQYVLQQQGYVRVPRTASDQCAWLIQERTFRWGRDRWLGLAKWDPGDLRVGDLVFWTGTYRVRRDPPVTHVMFFIGTRRSDGRRVIVGNTDGRRAGGVKTSGLSVYDFPMPDDARTAAQRRLYGKLYGFGGVPGMRRGTAVR